MVSVEDVCRRVSQEIESKPMCEDIDSWLGCLSSMTSGGYIPLQYKPSFLKYQEAYFSDVYEEYRDHSLVLYRGEKPIGIWPLCIFRKLGGVPSFGTAGAALMGPIFSQLPKAEAQRAVIEKILNTLFRICKDVTKSKEALHFQETILDSGMSQWGRKVLEHSATCEKVTWHAFTDLSLPWDGIQSQMRRTNKYSFEKGMDEFNIEIYDEKSPCIDKIFAEFHSLHRLVSGRETRGQKTWDIQKEAVSQGDDRVGKGFLVVIRDKVASKLAGAALFDTTQTTGLYCVAAYDRTRFAKPVGHIVQAAAMRRMQEYGLKWYEIGERAYPKDAGTNNKLVNIGLYKEGFATHLYPRVVWALDTETFFSDEGDT